MNYFYFSGSSYGMCNRTAISSLPWLPILAMLVGVIPAVAVAAASPDLEQACRPYISTEEPVSEFTEENIPFGNAVFWRIQKDKTTSHILGTIHSQDRRVTGLSPQQRLMLARSNRLLIEVVPDAEANQAYFESIYSSTGPGLRQSLPPAIYSRLRQIVADYGLSPERLNELEPWAAFSQIGRPKPVNGPTQDMVIYQNAVRMGKPVIGLETMPELIDTLSALPHDDQITILKDTICNHARIVRESKTLLDLYLAGDLAGMVAFNEQPHYDEALFDRFMESVLHKRNERMFKRMQPYLEQGGSFIAVGALHLPDDDGLLQMLDEAGYQISPVNSE